jgi:hypothetical protein
MSNFWSLILGIVQLALSRDFGHWTPITSCKSGALVLHYELCMRSAWKFYIYSVGKKFYPLTSHWKSLEQSFSLKSSTIQCKGNELLCPYEYATVLCCTHIVYLFLSHGCWHIPQTQITVLFIMQFFTSLCYFCYLRSRSSKCSPTPSVCFSPQVRGITFFTHVRQWAKSWYCVLFNWCVCVCLDICHIHSSAFEGLWLDECYGLQSLVMFFMVFICFPQNYCHWCRSEADVFSQQLWPALMHPALLFKTHGIFSI